MKGRNRGEDTAKGRDTDEQNERYKQREGKLRTR